MLNKSIARADEMYKLFSIIDFFYASHFRIQSKYDANYSESEER